MNKYVIKHRDSAIVGNTEVPKDIIIEAAKFILNVKGFSDLNNICFYDDKDELIAVIPSGYIIVKQENLK